MTPPGRPYPDVPPQPSFPELERAVIERWMAERTFQHSIDDRPAGDGGSNDATAGSVRVVDPLD